MAHRAHVPSLPLKFFFTLAYRVKYGHLCSPPPFPPEKISAFFPDFEVLEMKCVLVSIQSVCQRNLFSPEKTRAPPSGGAVCRPHPRWCRKVQALTLCKGGFAAVEGCCTINTPARKIHLLWSSTSRLNERITLTSIHHSLTLEACYTGLYTRAHDRPKLWEHASGIVSLTSVILWSTACVCGI